MAVWLNNILTPLRKHSSALKHTFSFVKLISKIPQLNQKFLVSFDVKSLFTTLPVNFTINLIIDQLFPDSSSRVHGINQQQFCKLLNWTCNHSTYQFKGKFYKQPDGMAMGSPLTPAMNWFIDKAQSQSNCSFSILRFVDDLFLSFDHHKDIYEVCLKSIGPVCFAQTTLATVIKALFFKMAQCLVVVKM